MLLCSCKKHRTQQKPCPLIKNGDGLDTMFMKHVLCTHCISTVINILWGSYNGINTVIFNGVCLVGAIAYQSDHNAAVTWAQGSCRRRAQLTLCKIQIGSTCLCWSVNICIWYCFLPLIPEDHEYKYTIATFTIGNGQKSVKSSLSSWLKGDNAALLVIGPLISQ